MTLLGTVDGSAPGDGNGATRLPSQLRRLMREREPAERCEVCSAPLAPHPNHDHLLEPDQRQILCACTACALLFPPSAGKRYRRVPDRLWLLEGFEMTDAQWEGLSFPVNMAFIQNSSVTGEPRAFYPSPAGATESMLGLDGWTELAEANPVLARVEPDVEALLINRVNDARDYYLAPIDRCYELVGLIRMYWRGLSGGQDVWQRIDDFFAQLRGTATMRSAADA